jgi:RNA polymerase sigma factor (sigma-70 family)
MKDLASLVELTREGNEDSFAEIVRRFQNMAVAYSYSILGDRYLAEDASQEAFLESYLSLAQLREPAAFPGWFRKIVFKQCDRQLRRCGFSMSELENTRQQPGQVEELELQETKENVWAAINSLREHERTPVLMYYLGGHSQQEVADFLGVPVTTIKKRLFSARQRLRETLMDLAIDTLRETRPSANAKFTDSVVEMLKAARRGDIEKVKALLLQNKKLLTARDWLGNSALIIAVNSGHEAIAGLLFAAGVQPDIHEAAAIGDTDSVHHLVKENTKLLDTFSAEGFTPLALAAHFGHLETTRWLIDHGASMNVVSKHPLRVTPLHAALFGKQIATARLLIESGADVNIQRGGSAWPRAGWTALHYAAGFGFTNLIPLLLERGADRSRRDEQLKTPLDVAIQEQQLEAANMLK